MAVTKISAAHGPKVVEVLEELLVLAHRGELVSMAFLAEQLGLQEPVCGVVGRYRDDPAKLLGEMAVMKTQLARFAAERRVQRGGDFTQSLG